MKTSRMLECYCRINATADDAATAWSIPQSAYCDYPMKHVETCNRKHAGFTAKRANTGFLHRIAVHAGTMNRTGEAITND